MKLTVNLDTQSVITQPSPMRIKAGCYVPVEIAFTRSAQGTTLPQDALVELFLTPAIPWPGGVYAYTNAFTCGAGHLYAGVLLTATASILDALTRTYTHQPAHTPQIEVNGEIAWSFEGRKFRSVTFPVIVEAPVADETPVALPDPEIYPAPGALALKSELPVVPPFATPAEAAAAARPDVVMSPLAVAQWWAARLSGNAALALLGDGTWGLPNLAGYGGLVSGDGSGLYNVFAATAVCDEFGVNIADAYAKKVGAYLDLIAGRAHGDQTGDNIVATYARQSGYYSDLSVGFAERARADEQGYDIYGSYAQQWGYYYSMQVGWADWASWTYSAQWADWANSSYYADYANWANCDPWGYPLYGAGNVQWDFFGWWYYPSYGDVATFDGCMWTAQPGSSLPITVNNKDERFSLYWSYYPPPRTGWLVKQLDNRGVYAVLDPNDTGTELGWVKIGSFMLVPVNSVPLVIDNMEPLLGDTIHCTQGAWSDSPDFYEYQWLRNNAYIAGATSLTYTVVAADDGAKLQCWVFATNDAGTGHAAAIIPLVVLYPPANTVAPEIILPAGSPPNVGDVLTLTPGTWTGAGTTTTYVWRNNGSPIPAATSASYTVAPADVGAYIACTVTRTNIRGSAFATTAPTLGVTNHVPLNTAAPTLSGVFPFVGGLVTCLPGTWKYNPTGYTYQWMRNGANITGATAATYKPVAADEGAKLKCSVYATNYAGAGLPAVTGETPVVTAASGGPAQGVTADSSVIAAWTLNEASGNRLDSSANGLHLTASTTISNATGKFGMAANFPIRTILSVTNSKVDNIKSYCGWFKLNVSPNSYQRVLAGSVQVYSTGRIAWDPTHYSTSVTVTPNQWYFICVVLTGTNIKLWVNNQSFNVQTVSSTAKLVNNSQFFIGDTNYTCVVMQVDDVICWNRALTDEEVLVLAAL